MFFLPSALFSLFMYLFIVSISLLASLNLQQHDSGPPGCLTSSSEIASEIVLTCDQVSNQLLGL